MSEDPGRTPAAAPPTPASAPAERKPYVVYEATGPDEKDLSFRIEVQAKDRDDAIDQASEKVPELKARFDEGKTINLLALAKAHSNPTPIAFEVKKVRKGAKS